MKHPLIEVAFNLLSKKKEVIIEEELKKAVKGKEKEIGLKLLEDIRLNHWNISEELLNKLDSIVEWVLKLLFTLFFFGFYIKLIVLFSLD